MENWITENYLYSDSVSVSEFTSQSWKHAWRRVTEAFCDSANANSLYENARNDETMRFVILFGRIIPRAICVADQKSSFASWNLICILGVDCVINSMEKLRKAGIERRGEGEALTLGLFAHRYRCSKENVHGSVSPQYIDFISFYGALRLLSPNSS